MIVLGSAGGLPAATGRGGRKDGVGRIGDRRNTGAMATRDRLTKIRKILRRTYPDVKTQLDHESPFQLLVATILSAQCTDRQVNRDTGGL